MRTVAQDLAPQRALRDHSEEAGGKGQYRCDFGEGRPYTIKHIFSH